MQIPIFLLAALILLIAGVAGSFTPVVPAALLSVSGVLLYWWSTGYTEPGTFFIGAAVLAGIVTLVFDWFSGAIAAKAGGASNRTTIISAVVGLAFFFIAGPVGVLFGVAATVFLLELYRTEDREKSLKAGIYSAAGLLTSTAVQALVTVSILVGFLLALWL